MASYGIFRGLGNATTKIADDLGEKLREERLREYAAQDRQIQFDRQDLIYERNRADQLSDRDAANERADQIRAEDFARDEGNVTHWHDMKGSDGKMSRVGTNRKGERVRSIDTGMAPKAEGLDQRTSKLVDSKVKQLEALLRKDFLEDSDQEQITSLREEINRLLDYTPQMSSSMEQMLQALRDANPGKSDDDLLDFAREKGYIQ